MLLKHFINKCALWAESMSWTECDMWLEASETATEQLLYDKWIELLLCVQQSFGQLDVCGIF